MMLSSSENANHTRGVAGVVSERSSSSLVEEVRFDAKTLRIRSPKVHGSETKTEELVIATDISDFSIPSKCVTSSVKVRGLCDLEDGSSEERIRSISRQ